MRFRVAASALATALAMVLGLALMAVAPQASAVDLFADDEARRAILQIRERLKEIDAFNAAAKSAAGQAREQQDQLRSLMLELNTRIEELSSELAKLRGAQEQLTKELAELQRQQKDAAQGVEERMRRFEPLKVTVDEREFMADPEEKRRYEEAVAVLRTGEFAKAATALSAFVKRYPTSGYNESANFWLGNALYGKRDYKEAIAAFKVVAAATDHPKAPEALLAIANCQLEMKDAKAARQTWGELVKAHPQSEAAKAAKERLAAAPKG